MLKLRTHLNPLLAALSVTLIAMQPTLRAGTQQQYPKPAGQSGTVSLEYMGAAGAVPDAAAIDSHVKRADFILVTHTHYDHVLDVPHLAPTTKATVIGTESTENVLRTYRVPEERLITVRGGEDYDFGVFSVKVIPSLHIPLAHKHYSSSATTPAGLKAPLTLEQMHSEGGTLAYLIRFHGHQILAFGGMNYIEREIEGLQPDVALVGAHDIEGAFGRSAQDHTLRHHERAGGVIARHIEDDGPAAGGTSGADRAPNGRRVVGDAIALSPERIHRCANTGLVRWCRNLRRKSIKERLRTWSSSSSSSAESILGWICLVGLRNLRRPGVTAFSDHFYQRAAARRGTLLDFMVCLLDVSEPRIRSSLTVAGRSISNRTISAARLRNRDNDWSAGHEGRPTPPVSSCRD